MSEIERYIAPNQLDDALEALAGGPVTIVAGATDLTPQITGGKRSYKATLMNIQHIEGLNVITKKDGTKKDGKIRIGALVTVSEIRENHMLKKHAGILCQAADHFASEQIRNAATIGGNICNASPAGDMITPFLVLGAAAELARWQDGRIETRSVPLDEFFTGPGRNMARDDELLTAVTFDVPPENSIGFFRKSGPRPALEISTVSMGIGGALTEGTLRNVRVAFGAVGPTALRGKLTEAALEGKILNQEVIRAAALAAQKDVSPIDDIRATKWYRTHLIGVFTEELLNNVCQN